MANFPQLPSYPWGLYTPIPHGDVNTASEQMVKTVNASDGSSHAPTGDIAWSGANGHGFAFSVPNPLPFHGYLDPSAGLYFKVGGFVRFDAAVALDVFGPVTFYTGASPVVQTGTHFAFSAGSHLDVNGEANLNGATNIRGAVLFRSTANGGPATVGVEADVVWQWQSGSLEEFSSGAILQINAGAHLNFKGASFMTSEAGTLWQLLGTFAALTGHITGDSGSTIVWDGTAGFSNVVTRTTDTGYTVLRQNTGPDADASVQLWKQDTLLVPDIAADRVWTLDHPPGDKIVNAVIHWPAQTGLRQLRIVDGNTIAEHDSSSFAQDKSIATWHLRFDPSVAPKQWKLVSAQRGLRMFTGNDADMTGGGAIDAWKYDVIMVPALTATRNWTFTTTGGTFKPHTVLVRFPGVIGFDLVINGLFRIVGGGNTDKGGAGGVLVYDATATWGMVASYTSA